MEGRVFITFGCVCVCMSCVEETSQTGTYVWQDTRRQQGNIAASLDRQFSHMVLLLRHGDREVSVVVGCGFYSIGTGTRSLSAHAFFSRLKKSRRRSLIIFVFINLQFLFPIILDSKSLLSFSVEVPNCYNRGNIKGLLVILCEYEM